MESNGIMIKLTNQQASAFNSPQITKLFEDDSKKFPVDIAFRIADMIAQIQQRLPEYHKQARKTVESNNGKVDSRGVVTYPDMESQAEAEKEMLRLNAVEIEIHGDPVPIDDSWPQLGLTEAMILKPLISMNGKE